MYYLIREELRISSLQARFIESIKNNKDALAVENCIVGHQGRAFHNITLYWFPLYKYWLFPERPTSRALYWNGLGTENPLANKKSLGITVEINFAHDGNKRPGGCFFENKDGEVFIGHRGNLKRKNRPISKEFLELFQGEVLEVNYKENYFESIAVVGKLEDSNFAEKVGFFVHEVERIKTKVV